MFATTRAEIAEALSTVDTLTGYDIRPAVVQAGDAWPQLADVDRGRGQTWAVSWVVYVILPSDGRQAVEATDALFYGLTDALAEALYIEKITPVVLETKAGDRPALQITGRSE